MLKRLSPIVALAVVAFAAVPLASQAQPLADRLPADTVAYVGWAGSGSLGDGYAQSHLKAVLDASNFPALFTDFLPKAVTALADSEGQPDGRQIASMMEPGALVYRHPVAIAFTGVDWQNGMARVVVLCDGGDDADAIQKLWEKGIDLAGQPGAVPFPLKVVRVGKLVAGTVGYDNPEAQLGLANAGGAGKNLASAAGFKSAFAQVTKSPAIAAYVDVQAVVRLAERGVAEVADPDAARQWPKIRDALGLPGLKSAAFAMGFDKQDWQTDVFVDAPTPRTGLLALLDPAPLDEKAFKAIPADAITAGAFQFDVAGLIGHARKIAGEIDPDAPAHLDQALGQVNQMLEMDVEKDFFGSFGPQWVYYSSPSVGGQGILGTAMVNRLKDPAKAEQSIAKLVGLVNNLIEQNAGDPKMKLRVKSTKVGDLTIHYVGTPMVTPAWAIKDGNLYVGLYPQVVASAARQGAAAAAGKSILDNTKFAALRARLGAKSVSAIEFADLQATAPQSYGSWLAISRLVGFGDLFGVDSPAMVLPELSVLMAHLAPAGAASWSDDAGLHYRSVSPFPGSTLLASDPVAQMYTSEAPLMVSILLPALNRAREQGNRVKSASNLRQIGLAAQMHANENKGKLPNDIADLLKQDLDPHVFVSPRRGTPPPPPGLDAGAAARWVRENSDYVYVGAGLSFAAPPMAMVAYEKPDGLADGVNVLFIDGHVEFVLMPQAIEMIQKAGQRGGGGARPASPSAPRSSPKPPGGQPF